MLFLAIDASWEYAAFVLPIVLVAAGMAFSNGPCSSIGTSSVPEEQVGSASGISNMARYVGAAVMTAIVAAVYSTTSADGVASGDPPDEALAGAFARSSLVLAVISASGIALALLAARHRPPKPMPVDLAAAAAAVGPHPARPPRRCARASARGRRIAGSTRCRQLTSTGSPPGPTFGVDEMAWFSGRGERDLDDVLGEIDLIVTGPHAVAAFPAEVAAHVDPSFTRRLQHDFTDVSTSPVARRWAEIDPHVLYIEDPHPRAVRDANRARPADLLAGLREAFKRLDAAGPGERPSLAGVDAVRPVTFGYLPVLTRPALRGRVARARSTRCEAAGALGVDRYERIRDELIERVIEAKLRRLTSLDPASTTVAEWSSATTLDHLSIHDTMNHTAQPDGAICVERAPADRLPNVVALSNRGDATGDVLGRPGAAAPLARRRAHHGPGPPPGDRPGLPHRLRRPRARRRRLQPPLPGRLRDLDDRAPPAEPRAAAPWCGPTTPRRGACGSGRGRTSSSGSSCWDRRRGRADAAGGPGGATPPPERVEWLAERLRHAHDLVRRWGPALA